MKKIVLLLVILFKLLWGDNLCSFNNSEFESILEKKYANEMVDLKKGLYVQCAYLTDKTKGFMVYSYCKRSKKKEKLYVVSVLVSLVDIKNKKVIDSLFYKDEYFALYKDFSVKIDDLQYKKISKNDTFGVLIKLYLNGEMVHDTDIEQEYLSLFESDGKKIHRVLKNFVYSKEHKAEMEGFRYQGVYRYSSLSTNKFKIEKKNSSKKLKFSQKFYFGYDDKGEVRNSQWDKDWNVKLEDKEFVYKNGTYVAVNVKPIFDLKQIVLNTKKGLKYKRVVVEAMLLEEKLNNESIKYYEKIAINLYKHKHYDTAEMLFEKIIDYDVNTIKPYLYLGEIYWSKAKQAKDAIDPELTARDCYYYEMEAKTFEVKATQNQVAYMRNLLKPYKTDEKKVESLLENTSDDFRAKIKSHSHLLHDKELLSELLYYDASIFKLLDTFLRDNKKIATIAIDSDISNMKYLGDKLKQDSSFIYKLVKEKNERIRYVAKNLRKNKDFIYSVCKLNYKNFRFADISLKKEKTYIQYLLDNGISVFEFVDESIKQDRAFVSDYVKEKRYVPSGADKKFLLDKKFALETANSFGHGGTIDKKFYSDAEVMWLLTNHSWVYTEKLSENLKNDKKFMLALLQKDFSRTYKYLDDGLKTEKSVILASIKDSFSAFRELNASMQNDREFVLEAIKANGYVLRYVNKKFKDDKEIVLEAIKYKRYSGNEVLGFASDRLRDDKKVVLKAISYNAGALYGASDRLKDDKEVVLSAVRKDGNVLKFASDRLKKDREVVLEAVSKNGMALSYADKIFRKDREVVEKAVSSDGYALKYADASFKKDFTLYNLVPKKDKDIAYASLDKSIKDPKRSLCIEMKNSYDIWEDYSKYLDDKELMLCAIKKHPKSFKYADKKLKSQRDFVLKAVKINGEILQHADKKFRDDEEIVKSAIANYGGAIIWANDRFQNGKELVLKAIKQNSVAFSYLSYDNPLKRDKDVVLLTVKKDGLRLKELKSSFQADKTFVLEAVKQNGFALQYASAELQRDKEIVMEAIKQNPKALKYAKKQNREIVLTAVKGDGMQLRFAYYTYKKDKEIALEAVKQNPKAWKYISYLLVDDEDILVHCYH